MFSYVIVGIHGLNNKPPADHLRAWWMKAICEGLQRNLKFGVDSVAFELVYWADLMYDKPLEPDPRPLILDPDPRRYDLAPYTEAGEDQSLPLPRHGNSLLHKIKDIGKEALGGLLDKGTAIPGVGEVADEVVKRKAIDLHRYYQYPDKRREVRQRLSQTLSAAHDSGKRIMLIAHSMGSIVAFDVLSAIDREVAGLRVQHFVTVGSPLGLHEVKERIRGEHLPLRAPVAVDRWTNFADRKDKVALDSWLHTDYGSNSRGVRVIDQAVINGYVSPSAKPSHHKIYGYLRTPEVSQVIHEFMSD